MTSEQQANIVPLTKIGLDWVVGRLPFDDVVKRLGQPKSRFDRPNEIEYFWFPHNVMSVEFVFDKTEIAEESRRPRSFNITIDDRIVTDIPYQTFDALGVHRRVRGEKIDGIRSEVRDFYAPIGALDTSGAFPINAAGFSYRLLLSDDSSYDVYAGFEYLAELVSEQGPWTLSNVKSATNLRRMGIYRRYLTPEEIKERNKTRRQFTD